ncbi:hypothetical protein [Nannocystis pusilla]|uniref:hypothetical protein n=1 Tax=Nannocystis pusilla TaxID=889268 RepID=UPI003B75E597
MGELGGGEAPQGRPGDGLRGSGSSPSLSPVVVVGAVVPGSSPVAAVVVVPALPSALALSP